MIKNKIALIMITIFLGFAANSFGESLKWDVSSGEVAGYKVYYGNSQGNYPNSLDVGNVTQCPLNSLPLKESMTYYFVVTAYNTAGESGYSIFISWTPGDNTPPLPPIGLKAE